MNDVDILNLLKSQKDKEIDNKGLILKLPLQFVKNEFPYINSFSFTGPSKLGLFSFIGCDIDEEAFIAFAEGNQDSFEADLLRESDSKILNNESVVELIRHQMKFNEGFKNCIKLLERNLPIQGATKNKSDIPGVEYEVDIEKSLNLIENEAEASVLVSLNKLEMTLYEMIEFSEDKDFSLNLAVDLIKSISDAPEVDYFIDDFVKKVEIMASESAYEVRMD